MTMGDTAGDGWCNGDVVIDSGDVCGGVVSCLLATLFSHSEAVSLLCVCVCVRERESVCVCVV